MSDRPDNRKGFSFGGGISLRLDFSGGVSFGAGFGVSHLSKNTMIGVNTSFNIYNSGVGTRSGARGKPDNFYADLAVSPSVTIPFSHRNNIKNPAILNTFNNNTVSGVMNYYKNSVSLGSNFVFNSHGRNQRVGYLGIKLNQFDFNFYNDVIPWLGDRDDRWWTGGGSLNIGHFSLATDVFTGIRDPEYKNEGEKGLDAWTPTEDNLAKGRYGTYHQDDFNQSFNSGQTLFGYRNKGKTIFGFGIIGNQMWSQNLIHNNFNLKWPILNQNYLFHSTARNSYGVWGYNIWNRPLR